MVVCPKCGKELADGTRFCIKCGTKIESQPVSEEMIKCPKCEKLAAKGTRFCVVCGTALTEEAKETDAKTAAADQEAGSKTATADMEAQAAREEEAKAQAAEPKKEEAAKVEPAKTESKMVAPKWKEQKAEGLFANPNVKLAGIALVVIVALILLGALLSGGNKASSRHYAMYLKDKEIYFSNLTKKGDWQVSSRLVKDGGFDNQALVNRYYAYQCKMSEDGKLIFFPDKIESGDDGVNLYYRQINNKKKDPEKVDSSVYYYQVNKAATFVTYYKSSQDLYQYSLRKDEKNKIDNEVKDYQVSDDGSKVYYYKDSGELYLWTNVRSEKEKLDSDVKALVHMTKDAKTIYYIKDGNLYRKSIGKDKEKISSDVKKVFRVYDSGEIYFAKTDSEYIDLWYYDGKEGEKITDRFVDFLAASDEAAVIAYTMADEDNSKKRVYCVTVKKNVTELEQDDIDSCVVDKEGKYLYFIAELDSKGQTGELYKLAINGGKVAGKPEKYDTDVSVSYLSLEETDQILYFKEFSKDKGELYCDKKKIDTDVAASAFLFSKGSKSIVYLADYDSNKEKGTLKIADSKSGKSKKIADDIDISRYTVMADGTVLYLYDYSKKSYQGDLYLYKGNKPVKLDIEVSAILAVE